MDRNSARLWVKERQKIRFAFSIHIWFVVDDRFVLKEMSKTDVAIFENFAPKYFEYIQQCVQRDEITLLAKIFGVFRVIIKKKE